MRQTERRPLARRIVAPLVLGCAIFVNPLPKATAQAPAASLLPSAVAALGAGPTAGYIARGTATLPGPRGSIQGSIEVKAWGASHCRVEITFGGPLGSRYLAVSAGRHAVSSGPQGLPPLPLLAGFHVGCALLPQGLLLAELASGGAGAAAQADGSLLLFRPGNGSVPVRGVRLSLDATSGLPVSVSFTAPPRGGVRQVEITYSNYQSSPAGVFPAQVDAQLNGAAVLSVIWTSLAAHSGFTDADFPVAPPAQGGAQ